MSILELGQGAWVSGSEDETLAFGRRMGGLLRPGEAILLYGSLGSGKTCLTRGVAQGLDIPPTERVRSPSFSIVNIYRGRIPLIHIDLYRLVPEEIPDLGIEELLSMGGALVVEWPDRLCEGLSLPSVWVSLRCGEDAFERRLEWGPCAGSSWDALRRLSL